MDHLEKTLKPYLAQARSLEDPMERLRLMVRTFVKQLTCKHPALPVLVNDVDRIAQEAVQFALHGLNVGVEGGGAT